MKALVRTLDARPERLALVRSMDVEYHNLQHWIEVERPRPGEHDSERRRDWEELRDAWARDEGRMEMAPAEREAAWKIGLDRDAAFRSLDRLESARVLKPLRERGMAAWMDVDAASGEETNGPRRREGAVALLSLVGRCPRVAWTLSAMAPRRLSTRR